MKNSRLFIYTPILIIISSLLFLGCGKSSKSDSAALNKKITLHNIEEITKEIIEDKNISSSDIELFINSITRLGATQDSILGKTAKELIDSQEDFLRDRDNEILSNTSTRINLFLQHLFKYEGITINDQDKNNRLNNIIFTIANTSDKPIKKIEGLLSFYSKDGQLIKIYSLSTATEIKPDKSKPARFSMPFKHDITSERDNIIRTSRDLNAVWTPTLLVFSDGEKIIDKATAEDIKNK